MSLKISIPLVALTAVAAVATPLLCMALTPHPQTATTGGALPATSALVPLPGGPGRAIMERSCAGCHSLSVVTTKRAKPEEWDAVVRMMVSRGASVSDQEMPTLTQYLVKSFGPDAPQYALPVEASTTVPANQAVETPNDETIPVPARPPSKIHVNVNRAGVRELTSMLSLTRDEAETLIAYRKQHGDFKNWQQVGEIPGVPAGKIIEYQDRITF